MEDVQPGRQESEQPPRGPPRAEAMWSRLSLRVHYDGDGGCDTLLQGLSIDLADVEDGCRIIVVVMILSQEGAVVNVSHVRRQSHNLAIEVLGKEHLPCVAHVAVCILAGLCVMSSIVVRDVDLQSTNT